MLIDTKSGRASLSLRFDNYLLVYQGWCLGSKDLTKFLFAALIFKNNVCLFLILYSRLMRIWVDTLKKL